VIIHRTEELRTYASKPGNEVGVNSGAGLLKKPSRLLALLKTFPNNEILTMLNGEIGLGAKLVS
jgi:hypothetical protein